MNHLEQLHSEITLAYIHAQARFGVKYGIAKSRAEKYAWERIELIHRMQSASLETYRELDSEQWKRIKELEQSKS